MPDIRQHILAAESATPHVEYSSQVVREAPPSADRDDENYQSLSVVPRLSRTTASGRLSMNTSSP